MNPLAEIYLNIKVLTNAKEESVVEVSPGEFKVKVFCSPEKGKANKRVVQLIADYFKVGVNCVQLVRGAHSRKKIILLNI